MKKVIIIGVSSSIAIYKTLDLVSKLVKYGYEVYIVMTQNATRLVSPITFNSLTSTPVLTDLFETKIPIPHIELAKKAELFLLCPATFNVIGKVANGIADDALTTLASAVRCRKLVAPAMNVNMYRNDVLQENLLKLEKLGYEIIQPDSGTLACGDEGEGKLRNIQDIVKIINNNQHSKVRGKNVIVTGGGTVEQIDPVRFIGNRSSGKMSVEIAKELQLRGANVTFIHGNVTVELPEHVDSIYAPSTESMLAVLNERFSMCDVLIMTAAVSDFKVEGNYKKKIKKNNMPLMLKLVPNPDILKELAKIKTSQFVVGFSAETNDLINNSLRKLKEKNLNMIVANDVTKEGSGFNTDTNQVVVIDEDENKIELPLMSKRNLSIELINIIENKLT